MDVIARLRGMARLARGPARHIARRGRGRQCGRRAAAAGGWWAFAAPDPPPVEEVLPRVHDAGPVVVAPAVSVTAPATVIVVHVDGAVASPGVHELAPGARVVDAVCLRSQGLLPRRRSEPAQPGRPGGGRPAGVGCRPLARTSRRWSRRWDGTVESVAGEAPLDLNGADATELETLPGVGPTIAAAIIAHRDEHGPFRSVDELLEVPGIGPARLAQLESLVRT